MFFNKKPPIIEYWSNDNNADALNDIVPLIPASEAPPQWYRDMPTYNEESITCGWVTGKGTAKACPGIRDFIKTGVIIPSWCDFYFKVTKEGVTYKTPDVAFQAGLHNADQFTDHIPKSYLNDVGCVMKLQSPWKIKVSKGYNLMYLPTYFNNLSNNIDIIPGIRKSNYYFKSNIFLFFKGEGDFFIKRNTPLALLIPIKEEDCNLKYIKQESKEYLKLQKEDKYTGTLISTKFTQGYNS